VWPRDTDGVDLSGGVAVDSAAFFLSPVVCAGTGVDGRGESATPFCCDSESVMLFYPNVPPVLTLGAPFAGAQRCSRFLRLA